MKIDVVRGLKVACLGTTSFLAPQLLLGLLIAGAMGRSSGDSRGSVALGVAILLFCIGNGAWAAFLTLGVLAASGSAITRTGAIVVGSAAGVLFALTIVTANASKHFWLLPLTSALFVMATWIIWQRIHVTK